jgi:TolB-like protein
MKLFQEIRRRNVFHTGAAYVLIAWIVIQVTDTVAPALNLPPWTLAFVTWIGVIGFPFVIFFSWAYELTPEGIKLERDVERDESITDVTGRRLNIALVALLLVAIGLLALNFITGRAPVGVDVAQPDTETGSHDQAAPYLDSIVVLPLVNMSAISDNAFFAAGVHEEILTNLSRIEELQVVSRTTALRYIDSGLSLRDIGQELGVRYIVEGSVRRINNHVRITVQLIDATNDVHLWANNYDRELVDVFSTQSEVAQTIANSLHLEIQPETVGTLSDMPTESVRAYDLYIQALSIDRSEPESESALQRQRELLESAVREDPKFTEAWAFLNEILDHMARNIIQQHWFGETETEREKNLAETRAAAQRALDKAVALDPENVMTLLAQASDFVEEQERPEFNTERKRYIDKALELDPDNAVAWLVLGWWYRITGLVEEATPAFRKALELDPLHARIVYGSLIHFRLAGDQQMTTTLYDRLTQIAPEKGDDPALSQIPKGARIDNVMALFAETADESLIALYEKDLNRPAPPYDVAETAADSYNRASQDWRWKSVQLEITNDVNGLSRLDVPAPPPDSANNVIFNYLRMLSQVLAAQRVAGLEEEVQDTARHILTVQFDENADYAQINNRLRIASLAVVNDRDAILRHRQDLEDLGETPFSRYPLWMIVQYQHADRDLVVDHLLEYKAANPDWFGTDLVAVFHIFCRPLVTHPALIAFYAEEGKWIDYLSERVPAYSELKK